MLNRILFFLLAALLAFHFAPLLIAVTIGLLPFMADVFAFMMPDIGGHTADFYVQWAIGIVLFWILLKLLFPLVGGIMLPTAQRYGTTMLVRRIQGIWFNVFLFFDFCVVLAVPGVFNTLLGGHAPTGLLYAFVSFYFADGSLNFRALLTALVLFLLLHKSIKRRIAGVYGRVMRFLQKGRFGMGGSGRFAGLIDELGLQWRRTVYLSDRSRPVQWFVRLRVPDAREKNLYEKPEQGLFMGRSLYSRFLHIGLKDDRHMLTIAGSRSGKGSTVIINNLLAWYGSCVVVDPKGTNAAVTAQRRRDMGQDVYIVDPFHLVTKESDSFNPLSELDPNSLTIREDIAKISDALVIPDLKSANADHWDKGARTVLSGLIGQILTDARYRKFPIPEVFPDPPEEAAAAPLPTLWMIRELLALPEHLQTRLWVQMGNNMGAGGAARDAATRIKRGIETDEITNLISNADGHSEWLSYPSMQAILAKSTFSFSQLKKKPTTIYLVVPPEYLREHKGFLRLFINCALMQIPKGGRSKIPVLMIIDEFLQLQKMDEIEKAFSLLAGYNFTIWPFAQDYGGLVELYGKAVNSFVTNSRGVQVFSVDDEESLQFVSKKIGERSMQYVLGQDSLRITPLRTPSEVAQEVERDFGAQYIVRPGKATLILDKVKYYEDRKLGGRDWALLYPRIWKWIARRFYPFANLYGADPDYK